MSQEVPKRLVLLSKLVPSKPLKKSHLRKGKDYGGELHFGEFYYFATNSEAILLYSKFLNDEREYLAMGDTWTINPIVQLALLMEEIPTPETALSWVVGQKLRGVETILI